MIQKHTLTLMRDLNTHTLMHDKNKTHSPWYLSSSISMAPLPDPLDAPVRVGVRVRVCL